MRKKAIKIIAIVLSAIILVICLTAVGFVAKIRHSDDYVRFDKSKLNEVCSTITILDKNGAEIKEPLQLESGKQIPLSALHRYTYMAFVAVEDKRFFQHKGLDGKRVIGALFNNLKSRSFKEGASTISQQLIKNTHLSNSKNLKRKVNEMLLAIELENNYSKEEILEMYLNTIYFGRSAYGIENAANVYFDKSASDLTVSESAILAGMIKAPNIYAPDKNEAKCQARRDTVLALMQQQKIISAEEKKQAVNEKIQYKVYHARCEKTYTNQVVEEACKLLNMSQSQLLKSGFIIETYCDAQVQQMLSATAAADTTIDKDGKLADLSCVICEPNGGVCACYFRGESALTPRQIGSTAKPIAVYTPALNEKLITQASPILDEPTDFAGYKPCNANGYNGWTTVKNSVVKSLNVPAVKTLNTLGLDTAQKYLSKLGFEGEQNLSVALGNFAGGVTPLQLANCYNTLATGGISTGVAYISRISGENGEIYTRKSQDTRVFDEQSTYLMTDMLCEAVRSGTAKRLAGANITTAAKTGTVGNESGNSQALVAGYTTQHTYVFWYSGNLPNSVNGATNPCMLAQEVLCKMYDEQKPQCFERPKDVCEITVDAEALYNRQIVEVADKGEKFLFDSANKPNTKSKKTYNYQISTEVCGDDVVIALPDADGSWKVFDSSGNQLDSLIVEGGKYYAELWQNGVKVYVTPTIEVVKPSDEENSEDFWDFLKSIW